MLDPQAPAAGVPALDATPGPLAEAVATPTSDTPPAVRPAQRLASFVEVILCSGFVTQIAVMVALAMAGLQPLTPAGQLSLTYVTALSLLDTVVLTALVLLFLRVRGDSPRALFLGRRRAMRETTLGVLLVPAVFLAVGAVSAVIQRYAPWLHNVPDNPLASLLRDWPTIALFSVVVVVAGGFREEIQRAFILDRFERHLGGAAVGLVVFSVAFGAGHLLQGWDAGILTAMLGAIWGLVFLWRRSIVAPLVCHSLFNLAEVLFHGAARV